MILGLLAKTRSWKCVGPWRCIAAIAVVVGFDFLSGFLAGALLGARTGTDRRDHGTGPGPEPKRPLDCMGIPLGSTKGRATA